MTNKLIIERYQDYVYRRVSIAEGGSKDRTYGGIPLYKVPSTWAHDSYNYSQHLVLMYKATFFVEAEYHFAVTIKRHPYAIYGNPVTVNFFQSNLSRTIESLSHEDGLDISVVYGGKQKTLRLIFQSNRIRYAVGKQWDTLRFGYVPNFPLEVIDANTKKPDGQVEMKQGHTKENGVQMDIYDLTITDPTHLAQPIHVVVYVKNGEVNMQQIGPAGF